jgi:predicted phage terminase large subunit-like protein
MKKIAGGRTNSGAKSLLRTAGGGLRFSTMVRGKATGWHADFQVMDDPTKPADIQAGGDQARLALDKTRTTWASTFASRKANPKTFARVIVMQRLHEHDLSATAEAEGYTVLRLPMEYDPKRHCKTPWGEDWRTVAGELLAPGRFDRDTVETTKRELGPRAAAAQLQQDPTSDAGAVFDRSWFTRRWTEIPAGCRWWQSWDCTFKASGGSDYVVGQVWAQKGVDYYLVDQVRARMTFTATLQAIRDMTAKHKRARLCLVEDKANGTAVMDTLRGEIPGLVAVEPLGGKVARAQATTGLWQAGQVLLPAGAEWTGEFVEEHASFPLGAHDDQVDAASQALTHGSGKARVSGKLNKIKSALTGGGPVIQGVMRVRGDLRAIEDALSKIRAVGEIKCKAADTPEGWHVITMTGDLGLAKWAIQKQELGQVQ